MQIDADKVVFIHYVLTAEDGTLIDRSAEDSPLAYLHGSGNIVPGLEEALAGKAAGDNVNVRVTPEQGYGERHEELVQHVPRSAFSGIESIEVGMRFEAHTETGTRRVVTVVDVGDENVTVDGNHPLAGQTLCFDVDVVRVREASAEEIEHGHVHD